MRVIDILDQLSATYGHPTSAILAMNDAAFHSPYLAADAPEVLFHWIEECSEIAFLGPNCYTDCKLIKNAIRLLLTTGLYLQPFEEWDCLLPMAQTWITLRTMIQELFQQRLNAMAPTAGHQGYAMVLPWQQNAFGVLATSTHHSKLFTGVEEHCRPVEGRSKLSKGDEKWITDLIWFKVKKQLKREKVFIT